MADIHTTEWVKKLDAIVSTGGDGRCTKLKKPVVLRGIVLQVHKVEDEPDINVSVEVHFDTNTWNVRTDGLIYTDKTFLTNLLRVIGYLGFKKDNLFYSTQGWQSWDYVHFDFTLPADFDYSQFTLEKTAVYIDPQKKD
jgi:hypothetical protein